MRRTSGKSVLCLTVAISLLLWPALVSAHLALTRSTPGAGATLDASPSELQLWFSEQPVLLLSGITLTGPSGAVKLGRARAGADRSLIVSVGTTLEAGAYRIAWKAAGDDGHVVQGRVDFSVKPAK